MPGRTFLDQLGVAGELIQFFWKRKLWWIFPLITLLLLLGILLIFAQSSPIAPFIYTFF